MYICIYIYVIYYISLYCIDMYDLSISSNSSERKLTAFSTSRHEKLFAWSEKSGSVKQLVVSKPLLVAIPKNIQKERKVNLYYVNWNVLFKLFGDDYNVKHPKGMNGLVGDKIKYLGQ